MCTRSCASSPPRNGGRGLLLPCPLSHEQAASSIARMSSTLRTPLQGGEEEKRNTPPTPHLLFSSSQLSTHLTHLLLILTMEEAFYLQDRGRRGVGRLLHHEVERRYTMEYAAYSSSRWRRHPTPRPLSCAGGQGVGPVLSRYKITRWRGGVQRLQYSILRRGWWQEGGLLLIPLSIFIVGLYIGQNARQGAN